MDVQENLSVLNKFSELLTRYASQHTVPAPDYLQKLERETWLKQIKPHMVAGHVQGELLAMMSLMIQPQAILEIGAFTGYSALCLARGLKPDGVLHTIEVNKEQEDGIRKFFDMSPFADRLKLHIGDALKLIPELNLPPLDIVYIDAEKRKYREYLDMIVPMVKSGGFILADNVLWYGQVLLEKKSLDTQYIDGFTKYCHQHPDLETLFLPVFDGILLIRKK